MAQDGLVGLTENRSYTRLRDIRHWSDGSYVLPSANGMVLLGS